MIEQVKLLSSFEEIQKLYDFVKQYPLDYPDYFVWLEKCRKQLETGDKMAIYATDNGSIIGSVIFQRHKEDRLVLEVKNFRVSERCAGRGIGSALEIMLCSYGRSNGFKTVRIDTHYDNFPMIRFLEKRGYFFEREENLYVPNKKEVILAKNL